MIEKRHDACATTGTCETQMQAHEHQCPCGCGCKHECPTQMWTVSFYEAKKSIMRDILKVKIQEAWGSKMEQTADLILEAMKNKEKSACELKAKLHELWEKDK